MNGLNDCCTVLVTASLTNQSIFSSLNNKDAVTVTQYKGWTVCYLENRVFMTGKLKLILRFCFLRVKV